MSTTDPNSLIAAGYSIRTVALGVGIPLILAGLCLVGTTAVVLSSVVVKRKRGKMNGTGNFLLLT
jgi:hypothetical protein